MTSPHLPPCPDTSRCPRTSQWDKIRFFSHQDTKGMRAGMTENVETVFCVFWAKPENSRQTNRDLRLKSIVSSSSTIHQMSYHLIDHFHGHPSPCRRKMAQTCTRTWQLAIWVSLSQIISIRLVSPLEHSLHQPRCLSTCSDPIPEPFTHSESCQCCRLLFRHNELVSFYFIVFVSFYSTATRRDIPSCHVYTT